MHYKANTVDEYINQLPEDCKVVLTKLRKVINQNLPKGFVEEINYNMPGYVVPHSLYPKGYHCNTTLPLPFLNIASQKNFVVLYHMGLYANPEICAWFTSEYPKHCKRKLDMGKSCVRFKKMDDIPYELIGELVRKMTPQQWIEMYESKLKN
ncbi:hypothetical protein KCTC32516_02127 [Polaribacter huanghezhanensis]|uniref:DUF1801 domain-containing protein n=1 Tax=Polaribacter huanghezhanensis TaxID=1354726 RepID=UPI0026492A46|nr:DUF1801 domain-containing protein [Polaribacter huanghezhanensis]WKD86749.1 hypothetical protein KCTC32516_02127 [Polaribacter huanghezhanensis]